MALLVPQVSPELSTTVICGRYHPCHMSSLLLAFNLKALYKISNKLVYEIKYQHYFKKWGSSISVNSTK